MAKERLKSLESLLGKMQQQLCAWTIVHGLQKLGFIRLLRIDQR